MSLRMLPKKKPKLPSYEFLLGLKARCDDCLLRPPCPRCEFRDRTPLPKRRFPARDELPKLTFE